MLGDIVLQTLRFWPLGFPRFKQCTKNVYPASLQRRRFVRQPKISKIFSIFSLHFLSLQNLRNLSQKETLKKSILLWKVSYDILVGSITELLWQKLCRPKALWKLSLWSQTTGVLSRKNLMTARRLAFTIKMKHSLLRLARSAQRGIDKLFW